MSKDLGARRRHLTRTAVVAAPLVAGAVLGPAAVAADGSAHAASPAVVSFSPGHGRSGAHVRIRLSGFASGQPVRVAVGTSAPVRTDRWKTRHTLGVTVPAGARSGRIHVVQGAVSATSSRRFVVTQPTRVSAAVSRTLVAWPHRVQVTGRVSDAAGAVRHAVVRLQERYRGRRRWLHVPGTHRLQTGHLGKATFWVRPQRATVYRILSKGTSAHAAGTSAKTAIVHLVPELRLHAPGAVPYLGVTPVHGVVLPRVPGRVTIERKVAGGWRPVAHPLTHDGRFTAALHLRSIGRHRLRAVRPSDGVRRRSVSHGVSVQVVHRDLADGDSGPDVRALQRRLKHLHYDVGAVSGTFGYDTLHAVTAFEKVQRLPDNGVVGATVWQRLAHPRRLHLRHPLSGVTAVEVNLTRQVVILAKNGHVWRIIDASTAGGYYYTGSGGSTEKAVTPKGHFSVQYKIDGWHKSPLGELYKPAFFTDTGYAIHGEGAVPPYPASHGCVRITVPAMDRYYNDFYVGQSVWIYGNPPPGHA
jgi:hypothetical protein